MISQCTSLHGISALLLLLAVPFAGAQNTGITSPNAPPYDYPHFSPSLALTMAGIVVALFFMVFLFALYVRYCDNWTISESVRAVAGVVSRRGAAARGLDASVIETFPTFLYSDVRELKIGKGALECAVCLCEFEDHETLRLIPNCDHVFHPDCIGAWLSSHSTCPVCRADLSPAFSAEKESGSDIETAEARVSHAPPQAPGIDRVEVQVQMQPPVEHLSDKMNRNRTRGSRSGRPRRFPRSHSTGHSLVQPGDDVDRFTLRLPTEVRREIMKNRELHRSNSMVVLPREGSSRRGYRTGWEGGGGRRSYRRTDSLGPVLKSDRWIFNLTPTFLMRALSIKTPKVNEETSDTAMEAPIFAGARSDKSPEMDCEEGGSCSNWQPDRRGQLSNMARPPA